MEVIGNGYSFVAKLSWKKIFFFGKIFVFFTKYTLFAEKNVFIWKKNFFDRKKYKWKCKKYISHFRNIFLYRKCLLQIKSFLNTYSFCKKKFLIIKNVFVKTSLWTQQSGP